MSNIFNLSNIFAESAVHDMVRDRFSDESYVYTAMDDLRNFNRTFMESTTGLYQSISEAESSSEENKVFCQYFNDVDTQINDIINKINETVSRFSINVENIVNANQDIIDNTDVITKCKPFTFRYIQYKNINDKNFPPINAIGIFKEEFDYIGQLLQELGPVASNQSKLKVIATIYNKLVKSDVDINKKCVESILGSCDDDSECVANFPEKLYAQFKSTEPTDVTITKGKLYEIKMNFGNYESITDSCAETASRLISQLSSISSEIKRIICGNDKNTYTVDTTTDGIRNTSYKMDTYCMNQLDIFLKTKINQVIQMCNIYYIAIAIKLDATMDYFKQCKNILTYAMANCSEDIPSDAAQDAQEDVDDDGELEVDDKLEDEDAFSDDDKNDEDDDDDEDSDEDDEDDSDDDEDDDKEDSDNDDEDSDKDDYQLEDINMDSNDNEESAGDAVNDLDEALNDFKEACMSMNYKNFCADTLYEYTNMLSGLVSLYEADDDNTQTDGGDNNPQQNNNTGNDAKESIQKVVDKAKEGQQQQKKSIFQKIKDMINSLIELIKGKFRKTYEDQYRKKIQYFRENEKYIQMDPVDYANDNGEPVTDFDVNLNAFNAIAVPRFDENAVKNIEDEDSFVKTSLKVEIVKDGDKTLSVAESIERKVLTKPSNKTNFNQINLREIYDWCVNYEKVVSDTEEMVKLLEEGIKNAERVAQSLGESTGQLSLKDTLLNYFGEASLGDPKESGDAKYLKNVQIFFNRSKDVITAKMRLAQVIFTEWSKLLDYQIMHKKESDPNKVEDNNKGNTANNK